MRTLLGLVAAGVVGLGACGGAGVQAVKGPSEPAPVVAGRVVLYCSVDGDVARPILEAFTRETGVRVDTVFDTEATKTTGLVNRLLAEKASPRADVWWSSEPFGTIRLVRAGVLGPFTTRHEQDFAPATGEGKGAAGGWPASLRGVDGTWYGFAERRRVLVYNTKKVEAGKAPKTLHDLTDPAWKGRVAIARPQFGTTRGHMARLVALWGEPEFEAWLRAMKAGGVRVLDGNAAVVRAVANGGAWVGLTDNDDVVSGLANDWPIAEAEIQDVLSAAGEGSAVCPAMRVPGTVAIISGARNAAGAQVLADWLLSRATEQALAESVFRTAQLRGDASSAEPAKTSANECAAPLERVADHVDAAMRICAEVLN